MCSSLLPQKATFFHVVRVAEEWEAVHVDGGVSAKQFFFSFSLSSSSLLSRFLCLVSSLLQRRLFFFSSPISVPLFPIIC